MAQIERQQTVLHILQKLRNLGGLKRLFWEELNYERENEPLSMRGRPDSVRKVLIDDPILFASGGADNAFHVVYCRLASDSLQRTLERPIVNQLIREHPYSLFVFSDSSQSAWHFLNIKYDEKAEKRRLLRRITVQAGSGLRTAAERLQTMDLALMGKDLSAIPTLEIQKRHDDAFDVESVTKAFYKELANWYFWAREHAVFPKDAPVDADGKPSLSLIRLITRLIFCWFLREKRNPQTGEGLLPDALFDQRHIQKLLKDPSPEATSYYTAILQNLFFATLNTEMDEPGQPASRRFIEEGDSQRSGDHMIHTFWRHASQIRDSEALAALLRSAPFLNGGLFECLDDRVQKGNSPYTMEVRIDGFSTDPKKQPRLPNFLFFGHDRIEDLSTAYGDSSRNRETVRPLLSILHHYNFTLTENTPFEQEVALDPELLGHVFENLLAAYNPETGTIARKATGSFYTPRVVVDWMVDQALMVYLKDALSSAGMGSTPFEDRLRRLLSWEDDGHDSSPEEAEALIDAIDRMKALDPACGSGAYPMGLLQKLVHVLRKLDPKNKGWRKRQEVALAALDSPTAREEASQAIERAFARDNDDYGRKLYLIENCLYGVDIQPIACQIAKLRLFISLIVDQAIDPKEPNLGILPLPNLETKIVAANTLLGLHRGQLLILGSELIRQLERELQQVRHDYFTARRYKAKKALRARDRELCEQLASTLSDCGECSGYDSQRLALWNPYDTNKAAPFFDPGWMFGLTTNSDRSKAASNGGPFDIVIGNPPYVRQEELKNIPVIGSDGKPKTLKDALKGQYECYTGTADLYVYFFERSLQLLRTGGVLSFITSNKYFRAAYGEKLRTYLAYATRPQVVLDFGDAPVFSSIAYPSILVTQKTRHLTKGQLPSSSGPMGFLHPRNLPPEDWQTRILTWKTGPALESFPEVFDMQAATLAQRDLKADGWRLESPVKLRLLDRLRKAGIPLDEYVKGRFYRGITTGLNEAFVVNQSTRDRLIAEHPSSEQVLKPFLRGRDVKRWRCEPRDLWLVFIPWHFPLHGDNSITGPSTKAEHAFADRYPAIYAHLEQFKAKLSARNAAETGIRYEWYALQRWGAEYWQEFEQKKIIFPDIAPSAQFAWDDYSRYSGNTSYILLAPKWTLGVLNSVPVQWFYQNTSNAIRGGYLRYIHQYVELIPVPPASPEQQRWCERLVEALMWLHTPGAKNAKDHSWGLMIAYFEQWLNGLVYELFFPDELHARKLKLFDETAKLKPPDLSKAPESRKMVMLQEMFSKAYDPNAVLRGMLFDLPSLEVVRVIEDVSVAKEEYSVEDDT
jgi:adenine-specific DNA-methyltransferase